MTRPMVIPAPTSITDIGDALVVTPDTTVSTGPAADLLVESFARRTGIRLRRGGDGADTVIRLRAGVESLGDEGYRLRIGPDWAGIEAGTEAGLVRGVQTLLQLAEPATDGNAGGTRVRLPGVAVIDTPRYPWRGVMLDVTRHFFGVEDVMRVIDLATYYKLNVLHLHLSDDQGWRIEIPGRPELTEVSGSTQVGDGDGGFYTRADYQAIVDYAAARHITVVPEIDMPGHTNAALLAYPNLAPPGAEVSEYRGTTVGFSSFDATNDAVYALVEDVVRELADIQPGGYLHIGGDEAHSTSDADYRTFVGRAVEIVEKHGLRPVAWQEAVRADLPAGTLVQYWDMRLPEHAADAARLGARLIMSPGNRVYLDQKYGPGFPLGLEWAGYVDVRDAYDWDPADLVDEAAVHGIEAPLWTETVTTIQDIETMLLPRLPAVAERAWSSSAGRDWPDFAARLAAQEQAWQRYGWSYHRSATIPWTPEPEG